MALSTGLSIGLGARHLLGGAAVPPPPPPSGFNPGSLFQSGDEGGAWNLSDHGSLRQGIDATGGAVSTGDLAGSVLDLGPNNLHLLSPANSQRPLAATNGGKNVLRFNGTADQMHTSAQLSNMADLTVLIAATNFNVQTSASATLVASYAGPENFRLVSANPVDQFRGRLRTSASSGMPSWGGQSSMSQNAVYRLTFNSAADTASLHANGTSITSSSSYTAASIVPSKLLLASDSGGTVLGCDIVFALVINRILSTQELADVETYAAALLPE